jgi:MFS transporter, AAHS family, 4-hydroxybenzoate transporter
MINSDAAPQDEVFASRKLRESEESMTKAASIDVGGLIEGGQRFGRFQIGLMFWICTFMFIEGYDMQVVGYAAPAIIKAWHSDKAAFGVVFGAGLGGFMLGATILGNLGDRFGRKRMIVAGALLFGLFTLSCAWADGLTSLLVLRTIAGVGLGGSIPNAIALVTEYAPARERATRVGIMFIGYTIGSAVGGLIAAQLIPTWGWPSVFVVGGVLPIAIGLVLLFVLPESVRFLMVKRGRTDLVLSLLRRVRPDLAVPDDVSLAIEEENKEGLPVAHLFADGRASMTALLWLAYAANMISLHFLTS